MKYYLARQLKEDYKQDMTSTLKLCVLFRQLGKLEVEVMCFLDNCALCQFGGNFSELTRAMQHSDAEIPNITKACKKLEKRGFLHIWRSLGNCKKVTRIAMNLAWDSKLIKEEV